MKIYLGADHAGLRLKEHIKKYLKLKRFQFEDLGNFVIDLEDDYPDFAKKVALKVSQEKNAKGILFCGNGVGVCIAANKIKGIRAVNTVSPVIAKTSKEEDDTNVLCLAGRHTTISDAKKIVDYWLKARFKRKQKYKRRINKIKRIENNPAR